MTRVGDDTGAPQESLEEELLEAQRQVETLRQALTSRGVIDQAKGVLMATNRVDPDAAFEMLSVVSQTENIKLVRLAQALVDLMAQQPGQDEVAERVVRDRLLSTANLPAG